MRVLSIALLLLILYNMFYKGPCVPAGLCFLNQREGLTANVSNINTNTAVIQSLMGQLTDAKNKINAFSTDIANNKNTYEQATSSYKKTKNFAAQQEKKFAAEYDS